MVVKSLFRAFTSSATQTSIEVACDRLTAVSIHRDSQGLCATVASESLPLGLLTPDLNARNIADPKAFDELLGGVLARLPSKPNRVALVIPDSVATVSQVSLEEVPLRAAELDELLRWKLGKVAPFRMEDAQVAYDEGSVTEMGGREYTVSIVRRDILEDYEATCVRAGVHPGVVDLSGFSVINAILSAGPTLLGDWLLVYVACGYCSVAVMQGDRLVLFRNKMSRGVDGLLDLVHQTSMYYQDRIAGRGLNQVYLVMGTSALKDETRETVRSALETDLGLKVGFIELSLKGLQTAGLAGSADLVAAPIGLLLRDQGV
ncbi:MAG: hypothetical protein CL484_12690 [Acidobacteria bacterium]|nr:hypothetical protein [Acidobacteriota bacterium]